jgi:Virulence factor
MARYRIIQWRDLPSLVEADDGGPTVRVPLSQRFQDLIDAVAMREGASDSDAYLEAWAPGPETERPGAAEEVARQVAEELEAGFQDLVLRRFLGPPP